VLDEGGEISQFKASTTPADPTVGVVACLNKAAAYYKQSLSKFLEDTDLLIHATTLATNILITGGGAKTGLITTKGFRDIVQIRRGYKLSSIYNLFVPPYQPIVPRYLRLGVEERTLYNGEVSTPVNEEELRAAITRLKNHGVESIAICYLHSYANPQNEEQTLKICQQALDGVYLVASHEILRVWREYERFNTTVVSAYIGPDVSRYLTSLEQQLKDKGFGGTMLMLLNSSLMQTVEDCLRHAVRLIGSGPAAAPSTAVWLGKHIDHQNLISVDIGGTSFDICVIRKGEIPTTKETWIGDELIGGKTIDVHSVGAGGGSIAWVDSLGLPRVGPQSSGADPGPACYGRGGQEPTVTDADLLLGYVSADYFLGGEIQLDKDLAAAAVGKLGHQLNLDTTAAAQSIFTVANAIMAGAISECTTQRGYDVRDFALVAGGGAGAVHGAFIADQLDIRTVVVPSLAGLYSAFGILTTNIGWDQARSYIVPSHQIDLQVLNQLYAGMEAEFKQACQRMHIPWEKVTLYRSADMRYVGQFHEVEISIPGGELTKEDIQSGMDSFHRRHEELFTFCMPWRGLEFLTFRLRASVDKAPFELQQTKQGIPSPSSAALKRSRNCWFNGREIDTPIYDGSKLLAGNLVSGPAVIEEKFTTVVVPQRFTCAVDELHNYFLRRG
jgi:N-methylhydantoinase A